MISLASLVLVSIAGFVGWEYNQETRFKNELIALAETDLRQECDIENLGLTQQSLVIKIDEDFKTLEDKTETRIKAFNNNFNKLENNVSKSVREVKSQLTQEFRAAQSQFKEEMSQKMESLPSGDNLYEGIDKLSKDIYFLQMEFGLTDDITGQKEIVAQGTGTGFLLDDGNFITARHCVDYWAYIDPTDIYSPGFIAVSYTHLTLPTIYSV